MTFRRWHRLSSLRAGLELVPESSSLRPLQSWAESNPNPALRSSAFGLSKVRQAQIRPRNRLLPLTHAAVHIASNYPDPRLQTEQKSNNNANADSIPFYTSPARPGAGLSVGCFFRSQRRALIWRFASRQLPEALDSASLWSRLARHSLELASRKFICFVHLGGRTLELHRHSEISRSPHLTWQPLHDIDNVCRM